MTQQNLDFLAQYQNISRRLWKIETTLRGVATHSLRTTAVDEQLLPCKARCKFIQYMANKPDKFGLKFWMAVDVESKYFYNGFPYLGKNEARSNDVSVPTDVVLKFMDPLFKKSYNVTCDKYFMLLLLSLKLAQDNFSLVGTIGHNRKEIPNILKTKRKLHDTVIVKSKENIAVTIICYQCKKIKISQYFEHLNPSVSIPEENNQKKNHSLFFSTAKRSLG